MFNKEKINICFVVNSKYINQLIITLTSIFYNNAEDSFKVFILHSDLKYEDINKLDQIDKKTNDEIILIKVNDDCLGDVPILRNDFNKTPYYKLLIPELIPKNINRILYLDVDIVVNGNIKELYYLDINDKFIAAVPDPIINKNDKEYKRRLGMSEEDNYFNSGVLLFDLNNFRKEYTLEKALKYIQINGQYFKFHDQEVLNGMYFKQFYTLDETYNYITMYRSPIDFIKHYIIDLRDKNENIIIHFANLKPWNTNYIGKYEKYFWKYAKMSSVYDELKEYEKNNYRHIIITLFEKIKKKIRNRMCNNG